MKQIVELLTQQELNSLELAAQLHINPHNCSSYLNKLMNDNKIKRITNVAPYKYRAVEPVDISILKKMIPEFIKHGIEIDLNKNEIERVRELHAQI